MALKRLMPCLLLKDQNLVKTVKFAKPNYVGSPINAVKIYNDKEVDEIIVLDIFATRQNAPINFDLISQLSDECFMPLTYGGGVKSEEDFEKLFSMGVEKISINNLLLQNPDLVKRMVDKYGSQAIIASIDFKRKLIGGVVPYSYNNTKIGYNLKEYVKYCINLGCGEILLYSVDNDGTWDGFMYDTVKEIVEYSNVPVIATGGAGDAEHIKKVLYECGASGAALGSMAVYQKKRMGVLIGFPYRDKIIQE